MATKTLGEILNEYSEYLTLLPSNKIKCSVTNHEMSARCDVVTAHIQGKKFKKALQWYTHDFSEFLPDVVEHSHNNKQLYCTITGQHLNKIPDEVRRHMNGKKFKRLKAEKETGVKSNPRDGDDAHLLELPFFMDEAVEGAAVSGKRKLVEEDTMSDLLEPESDDDGDDDSEDEDVESDHEVIVLKPSKGIKKGRQERIKQNIKTKVKSSTKINDKRSIKSKMK